MWLLLFKSKTYRYISGSAKYFALNHPHLSCFASTLRQRCVTPVFSTLTAARSPGHLTTIAARQRPRNPSLGLICTARLQKTLLEQQQSLTKAVVYTSQSFPPKLLLHSPNTHTHSRAAREPIAFCLFRLQVFHPTAKMLVELSKSQDIEAGDGTTSVCVIAGALLNACTDLLAKGIHPMAVAESFLAAADKAEKILEGMATPVDLANRWAWWFISSVRAVCPYVRPSMQACVYRSYCRRRTTRANERDGKSERRFFWDVSVI